MKWFLENVEVLWRCVRRDSNLAIWRCSTK